MESFDRIEELLGQNVEVYDIKENMNIKEVFSGKIKIDNIIFDTYVISNKINSINKFIGKIIGIIKIPNEKEKIIVAEENSKLQYSEIKGYFKAIKEFENAKYSCLYEKSAGAIIYRKNNGKIEYLIIYSKINFPGCPKGHIEYGESEIDAAKREINEEVGLNVEFKKNFKEKNSYIVYNTPINKEVIYFLAEKPENGLINIDENEVNKFEFLSLKECKKILTENLCNVIEKAEKYIINEETNKRKV